MSSEILSVLEYMEKEKGIDRQDMIAAIATAIKSAAEKSVNAGQEIEININPRTGALKAWTVLRAVDSVGDPKQEIHIENAQKLDPNIEIGGIIKREIDPAFLGRIAAQTARQFIMQKIRFFEKERIYDDYKTQIGNIVAGTVRRREKGDLFIDLGRAEAVLRQKERIPGEEYSPGDHIRCLLLGIDTTPRGPELVLSRSSVKFVRRLFEIEVTEIADGTVTIQGIVREPGYRTKVLVDSKDSKVDPVGACVGARGARVKGIVRELGNEKIDIIHYYVDPKKMLEEAIKPAVPQNVKIDKINRRIYFEIIEDDLSFVIGKKGQSAKLTSRLIGWKLDIGKKERPMDGNMQERMQRAVSTLHNIRGIDDSAAQRLVEMGITTPEAFEGVTENDLIESGFSESEARNILRGVRDFERKSD